MTRSTSSHRFELGFKSASPSQTSLVPGRNAKRDGLCSPEAMMLFSISLQQDEYPGAPKPGAGGFPGAAAPVAGSILSSVPFLTTEIPARESGVRRRLCERSAPPSAPGGFWIPPPPAGGSWHGLGGVGESGPLPPPWP